MKAQLEKYMAAFNQRNLRERILIALATLVIIYLIWSLSFYKQSRARALQLQDRQALIVQEMAQLAEEERLYTDILLNNPNLKKTKDIKVLEKRLQDLDHELVNLSVGLVEAQQLPQVIRSMLNQQAELSLLGMEAQAPQLLSFESEELEGDEQIDDDGFVMESTSKKVGVYKHSVVFKLKGNYFDLLSYLKALEQSSWQFYWSSLDYKVTKWPGAEIQLEAYTLSTERGFIDE
ncbi:hypothetical protein [Agaribacterium sp. ZY112]|uniref:hypothetical protein n=1 Tax=Agaribacterium sp. ZY112 TaxID=3233574 RepID=UPI0035260D29